MDNTKAPEPRKQQPAGIPRWLVLVLAPIVWLVVLPAVHVGIPWALSHLGPRYGWVEGGPSGWNLLGYIPVAAGAVLLFWIMVYEFSQKQNLPQWVPIDWSPAFLMTGGPYAFSRNPMYIGELALWLGLAVLYGSPAILVGFAVWVTVMRRLAIREEAGLETAFGAPYRHYKSRVPRWIGLPRQVKIKAEPDAKVDREDI